MIKGFEDQEHLSFVDVLVCVTPMLKLSVSLYFDMSQSRQGVPESMSFEKEMGVTGITVLSRSYVFSLLLLFSSLLFLSIPHS